MHLAHREECSVYCSIYYSVYCGVYCDVMLLTLTNGAELCELLN